MQIISKDDNIFQPIIRQKYIHEPWALLAETLRTGINTAHLCMIVTKQYNI